MITSSGFNVDLGCGIREYEDENDKSRVECLISQYITVYNRSLEWFGGNHIENVGMACDKYEHILQEYELTSNGQCQQDSSH